MSEAAINVAIVGSRNYPHLDEVFHCVGFMPSHVAIVSGGATGVDKEAVRAAKQYNLSSYEFLPDWEKYGRSAGARRNQEIVDFSQIVIAFWDGESRGTMITVDMARKAGKKLALICPVPGSNGRTPHEMRDTLKTILDVLAAPPATTERTR